jgi:hypothetical protein
MKTHKSLYNQGITETHWPGERCTKKARQEKVPEKRMDILHAVRWRHKSSPGEDPNPAATMAA